MAAGIISYPATIGSGAAARAQPESDRKARSTTRIGPDLGHTLLRGAAVFPLRFTQRHQHLRGRETDIHLARENLVLRLGRPGIEFILRLGNARTQRATTGRKDQSGYA